MTFLTNKFPTCADTNKKFWEVSHLMNTNDQSNMPMNMNMLQAHKKAIFITLGAVGGVTILGAAAAMVWNCKQLRAARAIKRTSKILYQVGTAMRKVSCMDAE